MDVCDILEVKGHTEGFFGRPDSGPHRDNTFISFSLVLLCKDGKRQAITHYIPFASYHTIVYEHIH